MRGQHGLTAPPPTFMQAYPQLPLSPDLKESCKGEGSAPASMPWPQHLPAHTQSQLLKDRPTHKHMPLRGPAWPSTGIQLPIKQSYQSRLACACAQKST